MGLFKKNKKKETLEPLSEESIQRKLYGKYKEGNAKLIVDENIIKAKGSTLSRNVKDELPNSGARSYVSKSSSVFSESIDSVNSKPTKKIINDSSSEFNHSDVSDIDSEKKIKNNLIENDLFSYSTLDDKKDKKSEFRIEKPLTEDEITIYSSESIQAADTNRKLVDKESTKIKENCNDVKNEKITTPQEKKQNGEKIYLSSFKIDAFELLGKIKKVLPITILVIVIITVIALIWLNLWTNSDNTNLDSENSLMLSDTIDENDASVVANVNISNLQENNNLNKTTLKNTNEDNSKKLDKVSNENKVNSLSSANRNNPFYSIQICTYYNEVQAENLVNEMQIKKMDAFYKELTNSSGKKRYIVLVGKFITSSEATKAFKNFKLRKEYKKFNDSFIKWIK